MNIRNIYPSGYEVRKRRSQHFAFGIFSLLSVLVVAILFAILGFIIYKGIGVISWDFLTESPTDGMTAGGIWPAIVGTFYLMVGSALFAFPVGVMSGIYMNEYAPKGKLVRFIRVMTNNLSGIPSIVFGLFGMALFVKYLNDGGVVESHSRESERRQPSFGSDQIANDMARDFTDGNAQYYYRFDSCVRKGFRRNSPHIIYLRRLFFTAIARKYF